MRAATERGRRQRSYTFLLAAVGFLLLAVVGPALASCRELGIKKRHEAPVFLTCMAAGLCLMLLSHVSESRERKRNVAAFHAFGAQRGLVAILPNTLSGMLSGLRVRYAVFFEDRKGRSTATPGRFEISAYGSESACWPGEASVIFGPASTMGFSLFPSVGVPTAVDPAFDQRCSTHTRFPVPATNPSGQRLDGPHYMALPHHRRLGYLPVDPTLRAWLLHRDWRVSVYGGQIVVSARSSAIEEDLDESLTLCRCVAQHMPGWAECIRQAQAGAV